MQLFVIQSTEEKTVEVQTDLTLQIDISKLDGDQHTELLIELFDNMSDQDIEDVVDTNNRMLMVILRNHVYIPDRKMKNMVYVLEGNLEKEHLESELDALIKKYDLQDELNKAIKRYGKTSKLGD